MSTDERMTSVKIVITTGRDHFQYIIMFKCVLPMVTIRPASRGWNSAATTVSVEHFVSVIFEPRSPRDQSQTESVWSVPSSTARSRFPPSWKLHEIVFNEKHKKYNKFKMTHQAPSSKRVTYILTTIVLETKANFSTGALWIKNQ